MADPRIPPPPAAPLPSKASRMEKARAHVALHRHLVRELKARGAPVESLFLALGDVTDATQGSVCEIVDAGASYFVRHVQWPEHPSSRVQTDFVIVNDAFSVRANLALFAQLLMNGAADPRNVRAVCNVFRACVAGDLMFDVEDVNRAFGALRDADPPQGWEPPHIAGGVVRFCYTSGLSLESVAIDATTMAISTEHRRDVPDRNMLIDGRAYLDAAGHPVVANVVPRSTPR